MKHWLMKDIYKKGTCIYVNVCTYVSLYVKARKRTSRKCPKLPRVVVTFEVGMEEQRSKGEPSYVNQYTSKIV